MERRNFSGCHENCCSPNFVYPTSCFTKSSCNKMRIRNYGKKSIISLVQKQEFVVRIIRFADIMPKVIRTCVFEYCKKKQIKHNYSDDEIIGHMWFRLFMKWHPELSMRKAQMITPTRAQKLIALLWKSYWNALILETNRNESTTLMKKDFDWLYITKQLSLLRKDPKYFECCSETSNMHVF